jgi:hypothetical protein
LNPTPLPLSAIAMQIHIFSLPQATKKNRPKERRMKKGATKKNKKQEVQKRRT